MSARKTILNILVRVMHEHGYASLIMRNMKADEKDIPFISETVYGTIRNYTLLEYQWRSFASKARPRTALLLDMSIYQLFFMNVPAYAAVNEAVDLAGEKEKKFVNAILRRVQDQGLVIPDDPCIRYSHPEWIMGLWKAHYGEETALKIAAHDQEKSVSYGRLNTLLMSRKELEEDEGVHMLSGTCFRYDGNLASSKMFKEGKVLIQDRSSQEVVSHLEAAAGMRVLDACAAPGTKTQQIAMLMNNEGEIIAGELHAHRSSLITQLMERTGVSIVKAAVMDASAGNQFEEESFDRILIDAPCSGLGDLSHKPEIRWHLRPDDIDEITKTQKAILNANAQYLKKGGILVYSTCTLNRKENEKQIASFLALHDDYALAEEKTLFPHEMDADGFYYAKLTRH